MVNPMDHAGQTFNIKGIRDGLLLEWDGNGSFSEGHSQLQFELAHKQEFLQGSRIALALGERPLQREEITAIRDLLSEHQLQLWAVFSEDTATKKTVQDLGLATRLPGSRTDLNGNQLPPKKRSVAKTVPAASKPDLKSEEQPIMLLKETLRSGRSVVHAGSVIIMGDVNPGAQVIAAGDVLVWGRLRGMVHAGAMGDETAVICALQLTPTQLRIADQIAISPDERPDNPTPEQAAILDGQIVARSWQTR